MNMNAQYPFGSFYEVLLHHVQKRPSKVAVFINQTKITYRALFEASNRVAAFLEHRGVKKGDKIALFLRNSAEFVYAIFAASKIGAIVVPINTFLKSEELSYILEDSQSSVLIASQLYQKVVEESSASKLCHTILWEGEMQTTQSETFAEALASTDSATENPLNLESVAVLIYTSGTTGKPKGAMLTHKNIFSNAISGAATIDVTDKDRAIVFLPMFHSFTFSIAVLLPLYVGGSIVIIQSIQPFANIFKQILIRQVTIFFGVPDVYNAISKAKLPWYFMWFNALRVFVSGAAALQPKTIEAMRAKFRRAVLLEGYGLSEASPAVSMNRREKQKIGSVGIALNSYEIKIVDENLVELPRKEIGDIIIKGDNVMQGYLNLPEATQETIINSWLLTGDMGYMDEENFLFIVDRKKDLIISKGINIYPREIEEIIDLYAGVKVSAVIGIFDEKNGEIPVTYIELEEGVEKIEETALKAYLKKHLANFKIPRHIYTIDALPKNATGKVLKRVLKEQLKTNTQESSDATK